MTLKVKQLKLAPGRAFPLRGEVELPAVEHEGMPIASGMRISFQGEAVYQPETIYLSLQIRAEVERECSRCLKHYAVSIEREEEIALREERDVGLEDDEFAYPDGAEEVDLTPYLRSLVLSMLDPKPLCRPDCRGICPYCGVDLNEEGHHPGCLALRREVDPRLAQLLELL
jgi:uncharacterized protein